MLSFLLSHRFFSLFSHTHNHHLFSHILLEHLQPGASNDRADNPVKKSDPDGQYGPTELDEMIQKRAEQPSKGY